MPFSIFEEKLCIMYTTMEQNMLSLLNVTLIVVEFVCLLYYYQKYRKTVKRNAFVKDRRMILLLLLLLVSVGSLCIAPSADVMLSCLICESLYALHFSLERTKIENVIYESLGLFVVTMGFFHFRNGLLSPVVCVIATCWCAGTDFYNFILDRHGKFNTDYLALSVKALMYFLAVVILMSLFLAFDKVFPQANSAVLILSLVLIVHEVFLISRYRFLMPSSDLVMNVQSIVLDCIGEFESIDSSQNACDRLIFERICMHFEREKMYLNPTLTIEDLAHAIYSNKSYVSRSIKNCSSDNFCTYINRLRIQYAIEEFKKDPGMKISSLAMVSGFRTVQTFTNAFKDIMTETPTEWCKYYKSCQK